MATLAALALSAPGAAALAQAGAYGPATVEPGAFGPAIVQPGGDSRAGTHPGRYTLVPVRGEFGALQIDAWGDARLLRRYWPATLTSRLQSRPGAWYALIEVEVPPGEAVQLLLRPRLRGSQLRLTALDAWPEETSNQAVALPVRPLPGRDAGWLASTPFVLPGAGGAPSVFMLAEFWNRSGAAPPATWVALAPAAGPVSAPGNSAGPPTSSLAPRPPSGGLAPPPLPGPLSTPRVEGGLIVLPFVYGMSGR